VNIHSDEWTTTLHIAVKLENLEIVQVLLKAGADVNFHFEEQDTALYLAAESGNSEIVKALLDADVDADVNCNLSTQGATQRKAAEVGRVEVFNLLLMSGGVLETGGRLCYIARLWMLCLQQVRIPRL
jgi:ankyrin repeat protein